MIDVWSGTALRDGGCYECGPDDRADDMMMCRLGTVLVRLCPDHANQLSYALRSWSERRSLSRPGT